MQKTQLILGAQLPRLEEIYGHVLYFREDLHELLAHSSDWSPEELATVIDEVPKPVTREPLGVGSALADFSRLVFNKANT